jgi:hypothetical protein
MMIERHTNNQGGMMKTQAEIGDEIESVIPVVLWGKYAHLSFGEMADVPELHEWAEMLRVAETEWFEAEN